MDPRPVLSVRGLRKSYGDREVVRDVSFDVAAGEWLGVGARVHNDAPTELPVGVVTGIIGVVTGIIGAPYLVWLLARANRTGTAG